jgi:transcriptional regulator with GAF, ATPase, and Fis domain
MVSSQRPFVNRGIICESPPMQALIRQSAVQLAVTLTVPTSGEPRTGRELVTRAIMKRVLVQCHFRVKTI